MRIKAVAFAVFVLSFALAGCLGRGEPSDQTTIDNRFGTGGFAWDSGMTVYVFAGARQSKGRVEICAAYMPTSGSPLIRSLNTDALSGAVVRLAGKRIFSGLDFSNELPDLEKVVGQSARCALSNVPWQSAFDDEKPEIHFPRMRFSLNRPVLRQQNSV